MTCPVDAASPTGGALLEIRGLKTHFTTDDGVVQAVDGRLPKQGGRSGAGESGGGGAGERGRAQICLLPFL